MTNKKTTESDKLKKEIDKSAKLFDVSHPGKSAPSATSRPIIVGHGSMVAHDPMVVTGDTEKAEDKQPAKITVRELKIQPDKPAAAGPEEPSPAEATGDTVEPSDPVSEEQPPVETAAQDVTAVPEAAPANAGPAESSETGVVNSLMNEVDAKQADKKQKKDLEILTTELEKSIETKEFFVPIGLESRRRSHNRLTALLVLSLILGLIGLNFAIDAEFVDIGIPALTDLL